ncbi:hypothetical protein M378DRAFT_158036 [Amanita muscaria Koide BX008]|uniref:Uncharacterized protein n=1 Tax=Amanita muscaria (strain Koide BX008) TaxID=946122 RepID=A0A0C2XIT7_AMAMK|nr:hypothetical protein M378DRAFT_158036 [Amanita muscaria Koide BX008]
MTQHFRDSNFVQLLAANYTRIKALFPNEGRRNWHLRVLQDFWTSNDRNQSPTLASKVPAVRISCRQYRGYKGSTF